MVFLRFKLDAHVQILNSILQGGLIEADLKAAKFRQRGKRHIAAST
jgi:hypothetical protein